MIGAFIAATVVTLSEFVRVGDRRLVPLMAAQLLAAFLLDQGLWGGSPLVPAALCFASLGFALRRPARPTPEPRG